MGAQNWGIYHAHRHKKSQSQKNELLCMGIAHNITVLVRQMFEAGTQPHKLRPPAPAPIVVPPRLEEEPRLCLNPNSTDTGVILSALSR